MKAYIEKYKEVLKDSYLDNIVKTSFKKQIVKLLEHKISIIKKK
jgi:hypothetical protein